MSVVPHSTLFSLRGLTFPALVAGPDDGPAVLCLHGFPDTRHGFFPTRGPSFGATLAAAGFRVVAPALRGTEPECIPVDQDYSPAAMADDALGFIDALGGRAVVVGNDWGSLATYLAIGRAPDKVPCAVTLGIPHPLAAGASPSLLWTARHMLAFQWPKRAARKLRADDFAALDGLYRRWSPSWQRTPDALDDVKAAYRKPHVLEAALGPYVAMRRTIRSTLAMLQTPIEVPTLALFGGADPSVPPALYPRAKRYYVGPYEWDAVPGIGHFMHREDPLGVAQRVMAFIDRSSRAAAAPPSRISTGDSSR